MLRVKSQVLYDLGGVKHFANRKVLFGEVESIQVLGEQLSAENMLPSHWSGLGP